ncbi:hypothetical protein EDB84DRAFT_1172 [Lactarius hengduanensis]|nr:hypothetical protein EDB84DRAFT_1172 [Lactarius hengduanensis]
MGDIPDYFSRRAALIQEVKSLRRENNVLQSLTKNELAADKVLETSVPRRRLLSGGSSTMTSRFPWHGIPDIETYNRSDENLQNHLQDAQGALLHAHVDATVDKGYLLELALKAPFFHSPQLSWSASVTDPDYPANSWIPLHQVRESFSLCGPDGFGNWVLDAMTIDLAEAHGTHNTVYHHIFRQYIHRFLMESITDGICKLLRQDIFLGLVAIRSVITSQGTCSTPMSMKRYPIADGCWILGERSARKCSLVPRWGNPSKHFHAW